jgi:hypothetical protein
VDNANFLKMEALRTDLNASHDARLYAIIDAQAAEIERLKAALAETNQVLGPNWRP